MYYLCKDCYTSFCKLPNFCKFCTSILINEIYLSQLKDPKPIEDYENKFLDVKDFFISFYQINLNEKKIEFIFEKFVMFMNKYLGQLSKKESNYFIFK